MTESVTLHREETKNVKWVGSRYPRKEDVRFVTGNGMYASDIRIPGLAHVAIARSPYASAKIKGIDKSKALEVPGVVAVFTGEEIVAELDPLPNLLPSPYDKVKDYGIAVDRVRYAGEPIAVVVAESNYAAWDAVEQLEVDYEPLSPVLTAKSGCEKDAPLVHENVPTNVVWQRKFTYGDVDEVFKNADLVVSKKFKWHRFTSAPLEPNVVVVDYDKRHVIFNVWSNNQRPAFNQAAIARALRIDANRLHFISPDIGGGFGIKNENYPYIILLAVAARRIGRPVRWIETRTEHMVASAHGSEINYEGEMAFSKDGKILGLRAKAYHDEGAYMRREPIAAFNFIRHATMTYTFRNLEMDIYAVVTNKCPVGPNRSYGKMQQGFLVERLLELGAKKLGIDPIEIRLRNFVSSEQMPYETPTGAMLDGGDYSRALKKVLENMDYAALVKERDRLRSEGKLAGVGISMGMDACPINFSSNRLINPKSTASGESEAAWVKMDEDGNISAAVGTSPQGHGHETVVSQIVGDVLGVHPEQVYALPGFDSWTHPSTPHSGTYASRFAIAGASAVNEAARRVREKVLRIAAFALKEDVENLELADGSVVSTKGKGKVPLKEVARLAWRDLANLPEDEEPGLYSNVIYKTPFKLPIDSQRGNFSLTYSYSACVVLLEIDPGTGVSRVKRVGIVEDAGNQINPLIVEGQVHGQMGHQLGAALYEDLVYDEAGQLLTATFKDYLAPTASDLPSYETGSIVVPSLFTPLGTRGTGEGGGAPLIACANAMDDALLPLGVEYDSSYLSPVKIRALVKSAPGK